MALALERMRKEHYVVREKEQGLKKPGQDGQPVAEFWYKLGPRAYVECVASLSGDLLCRGLSVCGSSPAVFCD